MATKNVNGNSDRKYVKASELAKAVGTATATSSSSPTLPPSSPTQAIRMVIPWNANGGNLLMTIPAAVRTLAGIGPGDELMVVGTVDGFSVRKAVNVRAI